MPDIIRRPNFTKKTMIKRNIHFHDWQVDNSLQFDDFKKGMPLRAKCRICGAEKGL